MASSRCSSPPAEQVHVQAEARMDDFATFLYQEDRHLFQNVARVKRLLKLADSRFRDGNDFMESFFNPCTHEMKSVCWAFSCHYKFNTVLVPHGFEMIPVHEDAFALQTIENSEDILTGPHDLFSMCICNWLLRTHWCISKVVLNVETLACYHAPSFWRLLSLNVLHLEKVEFIGLPADKSHFGVCRLFENATQLSEIIIAHIPLSDDQAELLCNVLGQNEGLQRLVLRYVSMTATALELLNSAFIKYCRPNCFELRKKDRTCEAYENAVANLLDTPLGKLCLEAPCNWTELFKRLRHNTRLFDLEIYDCGFPMYSSLKGLAEAMLENLTVRRLKICISFPEMDEGAIDLWRKLAQSIGKNRGLQSLILDALNTCDRSIAIMDSLAEAIAQNETLEVLSLEEDYVPVESLLLVLHGLARNNTIKTLHIGAFLENEDINRQMLNCVAELGLSERVDCEYALHGGRRRHRSWEAYGTTCFRKVRVTDVLCLSPHYTNVLHGAQDTLTSLVVNIEDDVPMADDGAQCLADLFSNSNVLEHVTLLFQAGASAAITILGGLARSQTVSTVVVGRRWSPTREVAIAFEETFQNNSSITELTIWQDLRLGFEELKAHIRLGVKGNYAISKVQFLYGEDKTESYDWELFQMLQCNRTVASWAADIIRGYSFTRECAYAFVRMSACNNCRAVLRRATGFDSEELESRITEISKRAETEMPEVLRSARESCHVGKPGNNTNALRTLNKDFIEEVTIFFAAQNKPPVFRTPNFDDPS